MRAVCIGADDDIEQRRAEIVEARSARSTTARGVVVLTDMFGGTPSNLAISTMDRKGIEVIAGVNLPMLIKLASVRATEPLAERGRRRQEAGRKYINVASQLLHGTRADPNGGRGRAAANARSRSSTAGLHARAAAKFVKWPRPSRPGSR